MLKSEVQGPLWSLLVANTKYLIFSLQQIVSQVLQWSLQIIWKKVAGKFFSYSLLFAFKYID